MEILLQATHTGWYGAFAVNIVLGIAAGAIVAHKGHGPYQIAIHCIGGILICGIGALISALIAPNLNERRMREQLESARQHRPTAPFPSLAQSRPAPVPVSAPGQVRCPRCGSMNAVELPNCWHCAMPLVRPPATPPRLPSKQAGSGAPPIMPNSEGSDELRVCCSACGKHLSGKRTNIKALKTCPKCHAFPFSYTRLG